MIFALCSLVTNSGAAVVWNAKGLCIIGLSQWLSSHGNPAGSQVDKPKHLKAHKIDFCGLFCCLRSSKKSPITQAQSVVDISLGKAPHQESKRCWATFVKEMRFYAAVGSREAKERGMSNNEILMIKRTNDPSAGFCCVTVLARCINHISVPFFFWARMINRAWGMTNQNQETGIIMPPINDDTNTQVLTIWVKANRIQGSPG